MKDHHKASGLLLFLTLVGPTIEVLQAQTVDSLIARNRKARGGVERLEAIQTLSMSGRAVARPGMEALVTREVRLPGHIRTEFTHQGVTAIYACDGSRCWYVDPMFGVFDPEPMSPADASLAIEKADILGLSDWQAKGHRVELLGKEMIDGRETYKLQVTLSGGGVRTDYLDVETALLVREETTQTVGDRTIDLETTFSDFRSVEGVMFPHSIKTNTRDQSEFLHVVVEQIEINPRIDDARFAMPDVGPAK